MPEVRRIARDARAQDYRMSAFVLGVARSGAFQMRAPAAPVVDEPPGAAGPQAGGDGGRSQ